MRQHACRTRLMALLILLCMMMPLPVAVAQVGQPMYTADVQKTNPLNAVQIDREKLRIPIDIGPIIITPATEILPHRPPITSPPITHPPVTQKPAADKMQVTVDKTEVQVGEKLTFKVSVSSGRVRIQGLWIIKDKERLAQLVLDKNNKAEYTATVPGVIKGMAIGKDSAGLEIYEDSRRITVRDASAPVPAPVPVPDPVPIPVPDPAPVPAPIPFPIPDGEPPPEDSQTMLFRPPILFALVPSFSMLEGTQIDPLPIVVHGKDGLRDIHVDIYGESLQLIMRYDSEHTGERGIQGYLKSLGIPKDRPSHHSEPVFEWADGEYQRDILVLMIADGLYEGQKVKTGSSFTIHYLRDSNRNGIADLLEDLDNGPIRLSQVPDATSRSNFWFEVLDSSETGPPFTFYVGSNDGFNPKINILEDQEKLWYTMGGTGRIHWAEHETSREGRFYYGAIDAEGNQAEKAFRRRFLRDADKDGIPDQQLSIAPIPLSFIAQGKEIKPIPIVVRTNLEGPVTLKIDRYFADAFNFSDPTDFRGNEKSWKSGVISLEKEGLFIRPVTHGVPDFGQSEDVKLHHFEVVGAFKPKYDWEIDRSRYGRRLPYTVEAEVQGQKVSASMSIFVKNLEYNDHYPIVPIPDTIIRNKELMNVIRFEPLGDPFPDFIHFSTSPLPPGLKYVPGFQLITGTPNIEDWQPWEKERRYCITVYTHDDDTRYYGEGPGKGEVLDFLFYHDVTSFYLTVLRDESPPFAGIIPIPDQTVVNLTPMIPVHVACDTPNLEFTIDRLENLPPGLDMRAGGCIEGSPRVTDWQEEEQERNYQVRIQAYCKAPRRTRADGVEIISMAVPATASFNITVSRSATEMTPQTDENPPIPAPDMEGSLPFLPPNFEHLPSLTVPRLPIDALVEGALAEAPPPPAKPGKRIAILLSKSDGYDLSLLSGAMHALAGAGYEQGSTTINTLTLANKTFRPEQLSQGGYSLVLAIGQQAADVAQQQLGVAVPLVTAGARLAGGMVGVDAGVSAEELLNCIQTMQPDARTIGYLYMSQAKQPGDLLLLAGSQGKAVQAVEVTDPALFAQEANKLIASADLLILAEEPAQREDMRKFFADASAAGKAVYVLQEELLLHGAAIACFAEPMRDGQRLGQLAARILGGEKPGQTPPEASQNVVITYNPLVLQHLDISPPPGVMPAGTAF